MYPIQANITVQTFPPRGVGEEEGQDIMFRVAHEEI